MIRYIFLFLLGICFNGLAQDSLVRSKEITYLSDFERTHFTSYLKTKGKKELISLFLSTSPDITSEKDEKIRKEIIALGNSLTFSGIQKKKPNRKISLTYDYIHQTSLRNYNLECRFEQIFTNGIYNCVTASALYSIIFDDLGIPYEIKEKPTHVYLLAYPNVENIMVETTTPLFGYVNWPDEYKSKFVSVLKDQKIIGADEAASKNSEELFNKYYFASENIDLPRLAGLHYINDAIFLKDKGDIKTAFQQLEKSYLLYPSKRSEFLLMNFGAEIISSTKMKPKEKAVLIAKLSRYKAQGITTDNIKSEFYQLGQEVLFKENDKALYKECYQLIREGITDKEIADEIDFVYNYELGRAYFNQNNFRMAKPFYEKALKAQPKNLDVNGLFIIVLTRSFKNLDNAALIDSVNYYHDKLPSLRDFNSFNTFYTGAYLFQSRNMFSRDDAVKGNKYLEVFESEWKLHDDLNITDNEIAMTYMEATRYHLDQNQKSKAIEMLNRGLSITPNSVALQDMKKYVVR